MVGEILIDGDYAIFVLHGMDRVLAMKSALVVKLDDITNVSTENEGWPLFNQIKVVGARIPGVVKDGRFLSREGLLFYEMHNPDKCVAVTVKNETYKRVVFEVEDKYATTNRLKDAISRRKVHVK